MPEPLVAMDPDAKAILAREFKLSCTTRVHRCDRDTADDAMDIVSYKHMGWNDVWTIQQGA
jgi:hypothetical protein